MCFIYKVNSALILDRTKRQWIDLGTRTEACMTQPETCGATGGAISMWLKIVDCPEGCGVISSHESGTGCIIYCHPAALKYLVIYFI